MATTKDPVWDARSRLALATKWKNPAAATQAKRDLTAAVLARRIHEALAKEPHITAAQRKELARLLRDGAK